MANRGGRPAQAAAGADNDIGRLANILEHALGNNPRNAFKPPCYDGKGDVELFIGKFADVIQANNWDANTAHLNLRLSLEKEAQECARGDNVADIFGNLRARYGLSQRQARDKLVVVRKEPGQNFHALGVEVLKLVRIAYPQMGQNHQEDIAVETIKRCIENRSLARHLLHGGPELNTVAGICRAADDYIQAGTLSAINQRARPQINALEMNDEKNTDQSDNDDYFDISVLAGQYGNKGYIPQAKTQPRLEASENKQVELLTKLLEMVDKNTQAILKLSENAAQHSKNGAQQTKRTCYTCRSENHLARNCPKKNQENERGSQ